MRPPVRVILTAALLLAACGKREIATNAATDPPPVSAAITTVTTESLPITIPVTGTLVSNSRVDVKAEVIGHISRFDKQEGDSVRAGEPVAWVDDENFRLAGRQAETAVQVAEAALERARLIATHSRSELERAENLV